MGDIVKIVGIREVQFTDKDSGREISGTSYYYTMEENSVSLEGVSTGKFFVSADYADRLTYTPKLEDEVQLTYNRYGKVADIVSM